ncbi:uncharacterized protein LOC135848882 isoform X1 [Planococcus citri]|uniref:uncharacterized protein LOC135848882 isoform X1 n=1 Tax=Planococcus citri TaxID=170843 RepID=UPI0031F86BC0
MDDSVKTVDLDHFQKKSFQQNMNDLRLENVLCDVRLDVNGTIMPCHRLVLAAASPYFRTMFNGNFKESNSDTIVLKDIDTETVQEILNAIYTATIRFKPSNAYFILMASHLWQLEMIENACVSYIMENPKIHHMVDTCVFANNIGNYNLYCKCISSVADNIVEYGKTDSFERISLDVFKGILKAVDSSKHEEESITLLIMKWSKKNNAKREDIQILLDATNLKTTFLLNSRMMSQLLVACDDKLINDNGVEDDAELHCDSDLPLNLYLNAIDVKTGERGWSVLKTNLGLDKYVLSSFHPTNSYRKKVCRVETKLYCFEYFKYMGDRNFFSYYDENDARFSLTTPELLISDFEMAAKGTSIYLMEKSTRFSVWLYNCELNTWKNIVKENDHVDKYCQVLACTFSNDAFYIISAKKSATERNEMDESIFSINSDTLKIEWLMELSPSTCKYSSIYVFGSKVAVFDCSRDTGIENTFKILNRNNGWFIFHAKKMKDRRPEVCIFHYENSLYMVENGRVMVPNEKCDLSSYKWTELPHLPQKITISGTNDVVAIGEVFGVEVNAQ